MGGLLDVCCVENQQSPKRFKKRLEKDVYKINKIN